MCSSVRFLLLSSPFLLFAFSALSTGAESVITVPLEVREVPLRADSRINARTICCVDGVDKVIPFATAAAPSNRAFTLAVISEDAPALADVFFAVLADAPNADLVERSELDRIMREAKLASLAGVDPLALGQMTKADALVLVRESNEQLFVRIVETARGVRLFEAVGESSAEGGETLARVIRSQVEHRAGLLASAPADRQYVAIDPLVFKKVRRTDRHSEFEYVGDLLAVQLSALPGLVCLEREALEEVTFEHGLDAQSRSNALIHADWLLRGVCDVKKGAVATVSLQLQALDDGKKHHSPAFEITPDGLEQSASNMLSWIAGAMALNPHDAAHLDRTREAETQFMLGSAYLARGLRSRGLRCLRVAHLLDRDERQYTWLLAKSLVGSVNEFSPRLSKMDEMIEAMDLCQFTLQTNACCFNDSYHHNTYPWADLSKFLQTVPKDLDSTGRELVTRFRARLRSYMEWLYGYEAGARVERGLPWLHVMCPYFFDKPEDAMAYMRALLVVGDCDWLRLSYSNFLAVGYWDRANARVLWEAFLREISDTRDGAAKYYAMRSIAMLHKGYSADPPPEGAQAVRALFTWLVADASRYGHIRHYMSREVWAGFAHMDVAFQRQYLGPLMMPRALGGGAEASHESVLQALERVYAAYPDNPAVRKEIAEHLNAYLKKWAGSISSFNHTKLVELLKTVHPRLLPLGAAEHLGEREGVLTYQAGLELVFDYRDDVPEEYREGFRTDIGRYGLCMDPPYVWITWFIYKDYKKDPQRKEAKILFVQFDMRSRSTRVYAVPAAWGCCHKALVRWQDYVCLDAYSAVRLVPFDPLSETLVVEQAMTVKGLPSLGTTGQSVTCLVPGREYLYIGTTPGMLFRWRPGMASAEQVVRHDLLAPGPLNDTNPYAVTDGRYDAGSKSMEFHIKSTRGDPKQGWWRYAPQAQSPWKWVAESGPRTEPGRPSWRVTGTGIVRQGLELVVPASGEPITVALATGHVRTAVRWCEEAVVWVVQNGNKTFDGPMRIYMIERENWPKPAEPQHSMERQTTELARRSGWRATPR